MPNQKVKNIITDAVLRLLDKTMSDNKIRAITKKHDVKVHFVPIRYRIFGGLLQSLNIQFGNFIEVLMHQVVEREKHLEIIKDISGRKNVPLILTTDTDSLVDHFISDRQNNNDNKLNEKFQNLLKNIILAQKSETETTKAKHDVDVLFKDKRTSIFYYLEIKYNDDHDTGKFADINRKFIKTYAGLVKSLDIQDVSRLKPILYYLTPKVMKGNIYIPEENNIYRGEKLFKEFFTLNYSDLDGYLKNISEDKDTIKIFDDLYKKIRFGKF